MAEKDIAAVLGVSAKDAVAGLQELRGRLQERGLALIEKEGEWQMATHPDNARFADALLKRQYTAELSRASLETLAIIAYKGPMTRAEIEYIRGVQSSFSLRALVMRGLVERVESERDARSFSYRVGLDFLKYLGLARIEDLPEYEALKKKEESVRERTADEEIENP